MLSALNTPSDEEGKADAATTSTTQDYHLSRKWADEGPTLKVPKVQKVAREKVREPAAPPWESPTLETTELLKGLKPPPPTVRHELGLEDNDFSAEDQKLADGGAFWTKSTDSGSGQVLCSMISLTKPKDG